MFALEELRRSTAQQLSCSRVALPRHPSNPRAIAAPSATGDRLMTTKPARSKCSTRRFATISDMNSSALWTRLRPEKRSANASAEAKIAGFGPLFLLRDCDGRHGVSSGVRLKDAFVGQDAFASPIWL